MRTFLRFRSYWLLGFAFALLLAFGTHRAAAQSTGNLQGTVADPSGAVVANATVTVTNTSTGIAHTITTDSSGNYQLPSLPPGTYNLEVSAAGFAHTVLQGIVIRVGSTVTNNVALKVSSAQQTVSVTAAAPVVDQTGISVGQVIDQETVQQVPLNGRHFVDLGALIPGSVAAPANGFLTQPIRGQGALSFDTAGQREDTVNFMINGINLNDMVQNQITFQPELNTVQEFKVDNSTFSAEYGRNSGAIVNIATRTGTNQIHGEAYNYLRNQFFDARNFFNRQFTTTGAHVRQSQFIRNQFGGDAGGPIWRDHTFIFGSYEGLRQRQGVAVNAQVPPAGSVGADSTIQKLLALLPAPNSGGSGYISSASAIATIDQGTLDVSQQFGTNDRLHGFYAIQQDSRNEPLAPTVADTIPGYGDARPARRQLITIVETHIFNSNMVNEARLGANRIHITFTPSFAANPATYGISNGINSPIGLPQTTITSAGLTFGGPAGEPQGRGDTLGLVSDTFSWLRGNHSLKFGGEFRRFVNSNFASDTGTFVFNNISDFLNDHVASFSVTPGNRPSRVYTSAVGVFAADSWKVNPRLVVELGFRFEWNGTPVEGKNRFVSFQPGSATLQQVGTPDYGKVYPQSHNYEPRLGFAWDIFGKGNTVLHAGYGILYNQPETNLVTGLTTNPPFAVPVSLTVKPGPGLTMQNAFSQAQAAKVISPASVDPTFANPQIQTWNVQMQQRLTDTLGLKVGYMGSKGSHLQMVLNVNQPDAGVRPYPTLSSSSPIDPGIGLTNILQASSVSISNYNAGFVSINKAMSHNLQLNGSYTWSKALDYNSYSLVSATQLPQDSRNPAGDYGPADFDARSHFSVSAVYDLPFEKNRLVSGWEISTITVLQTGNPFTVETSLPNNGVVGKTRPNLLGHVPTSKALASNGNVQYIPQSTCVTATPGCLFESPGAGFGNEHRNAIYYPGLEDMDIGLQKETKITERFRFNLRTDAFNVLNHPNFGQPSGTFTPGGALGTFGQISSTRFPIGDFGSSRQIQVSAKIVF